MILLFLSLMDFLMVLLIIAMKLNYHPTWRIIFLAATYLIGKSVIFWGSWMNFVDILIAAYIVLLFYGISSSFLTYVIIIWMIYKLVASFLG